MNYSKYGISESYMPTVYHNRIVIDKTTATTINDNLRNNPYINENNATVEVLLGAGAPGSPEGDGVVGQIDQAAPVGFLGNASSSPAQTLVTVDYNIVFNVPSYAEFVNLTKADGFADSFRLQSFVFYKDPTKQANTDAGTIFSGTTAPYFPALVEQENEYFSQIKNAATLTNTIISKEASLNSVFSTLVQTELAGEINNIDNFTRYQRAFPNGQTYFQVPYRMKFVIPYENLSYVYLASIMAVENFEVDLKLNFGGFDVDNQDITSVSALEAFNLPQGNESFISDLNYGPLTADTLIYNNKSQTKGVFYTIAQDQATFLGVAPEGTNLQEITGSDILREEKFNDLKGTPWLGSVHKYAGRYMAGSGHDMGNIHPFLDPNVVLNTKLIDLRPIKKVDEQKITFTPTIQNIKTTKINYFADNSKEDLIEKLEIISDPLLSTNRQSNIDGFFAINYTNFLRKHSVFSNFIENSLVFEKIFDSSDRIGARKIKIYRRDVQTKISNLVYDSSRVETNGIFTTKPGLNGQQFAGNNNIPKIPLGYLKVINLKKDLLDYNPQKSRVEFYTFTDIDEKKEKDKEYRYEIEVEMLDPLFRFLSNGIKAIDSAIRGTGKTLGLEQVLGMINTKLGKANTTSNNKEFSYVVDDLKAQSNTVNNSTIIDLINSYDSVYGTSSITNEENPKLQVLVNLMNNGILDILTSEQNDLKEALQSSIFNILDLQNPTNLPIDLIQLVINTLTSIRENLKNSVNAISNVDISTRSFDYMRSNGSSLTSINDRRLIKEKIVSDTVIKTQQFGFDYLQVFNSKNNYGLKQVTVDKLNTGFDELHSRYFNLSQPAANGNASTFLNDYRFSNLSLEKDGVVLPDGLATNDDLNTWSNIMQFLLLYKNKNVSKITSKTSFTYEASKGTTFEVDINSGLDTEKNLPLLKSLDRSQKRLAEKGLNIPDQVISKQQLYSLFDENEKQTDEKNSETVTPTNNFKMNSISQYFASYVSNAVESSNKIENNYLGDISTYVFPAGDLPEDGFGIPNLKEQTIPSIALIQYSQGQNPTGLPVPSTNISFVEYYENNVWNSQTKQVLLDKYAEFFFDFVNNVKVEYLVGFDSYTYEGIPTTISSLDSGNNINVSQYRWEQLTNDVVASLKQLSDGVLCRMVDFTPKAFEGLNIPLDQNLKYCKKYYKYFLIIGGANKDTFTYRFGSTISGGSV
jgi:hypothetical protein